jgi:hypothetical protein
MDTEFMLLAMKDLQVQPAALERDATTTEFSNEVVQDMLERDR